MRALLNIDNLPIRVQFASGTYVNLTLGQATALRDSLENLIALVLKRDAQ